MRMKQPYPLDAPGVRLHRRLTQIRPVLRGWKKAHRPRVNGLLSVRTEQAGATAIPISKIEAYFREGSQAKCGTLVGVNSCDEVDSSRCNHSR